MCQTPDWEANHLFSSLHAALVGGDARQRYLSEYLTRDGHPVTEFALDETPSDLSALTNFPWVILPMPITRDGVHLYAPFSPRPIPVTEILDALRPGQLILGGGVNSRLAGLAQARGLTILDYLAREELAIANAVPTAEGAVQLAMEALPITIHRSRILVAGFGRVGQCSAARFAALGAQVTIAARSAAQRALAESMGLSALHPAQLETARQNWDLVVNTVPTVLFQAPQLMAVGAPVLLELASAPGGFDLQAVHDLELRHIPAQGLPGRVAPATAAQIIRNTIYAMLDEAGI